METKIDFGLEASLGFWMTTEIYQSPLVLIG
jgi:hypothetical protein